MFGIHSFVSAKTPLVSQWEPFPPFFDRHLAVKCLTNKIPFPCDVFSSQQIKIKSTEITDQWETVFFFTWWCFHQLGKKNSVMFLLFLFVKPRHTSPSIFGLCYKCAVQQKPRRLVINLNHKNSIIYSSQEESLWRRGRVNAKAPFFYYSLLCSTSLTFIFSDFSI